MIEYYAPNIENDPVLPQEESAHCIRVLRKRKGDRIFITNGTGALFEAEIEEADQRRTSVKLINKIEKGTGRDYKIILAVAPTKNSDRIEWLAEKATEIGVDEIILLLCERNERKVMKTDRIERIIISAMKQSLKTVKPILTELTSFKEIASRKFRGKKVIGYCDEKIEKKSFAKELKRGENVMIFIGPEGDFTPSEVAFAQENGVVPVTFGKNRLRTETAALYGVTATHVIND